MRSSRVVVVGPRRPGPALRLWRMSRRWLLVSLSLVGALGGCDLPPGSNEDSEGLEALRAAREQGDATRYLVALDTACCDRDGNRLSQRLQFAPRLTQIRQNGRVVLWQRLAPAGARRERDVSYSLRQGRGCYDRHAAGQFDRTGVIEMRRGIVVPQELIDEAELTESRLDPPARSHQRARDPGRGPAVFGSCGAPGAKARAGGVCRPSATPSLV
jgi:hypothetical protein